MDNNPGNFKYVGRGMYQTIYGNTAFVSSPNAKTAYDIDSGTRIPIETVTDKFIRYANTEND